MKVLQLIDSLNPGGSERMAVNYANLLHKNKVQSHICATREGGLLKGDIITGVFYVFLNKKSTFDLNAFLKLRSYLKEQKIDILHAHSTSYFLATLIKFSLPSIKLIWHDHYGNSEFLNDRKSRVLKVCSSFFDGIISVNTKLKIWALEKLSSKNVIEINNFISLTQNKNSEIKILGEPEDFKIVCVANLRPQKDHETLLNAFESLKDKNKMSLHLIGNNPQTIYSKALLKKINNLSENSKIFYYGSQNNVENLLKQCDLGILSSISEGLPLALLEYGAVGLPVVCTKVGQCEEVIGKNGKLVLPNDSKTLAEEILYYYKNPDRKKINKDVVGLVKKTYTRKTKTTKQCRKEFYASQ